MWVDKAPFLNYINMFVAYLDGARDSHGIKRCIHIIIPSL